MRWALLLPATVLLAAAVAVAALVPGDDPGFTAERAESIVRDALERCDHELGDARTIECERAGRGWACRADGRFVASFEEPDPDHPELSVIC